MKERNPLMKTLQAITLLLSKPLNLVFLIIGVVIVYVHGFAIINQTPIYGAGMQGMVVSVVFVLLGVFLIVYCGYYLVFVKVKDQLGKLK